MAIIVNDEISGAMVRLAEYSKDADLLNLIGEVLDRSIQKNFKVGGRYGMLDGETWTGGTSKWTGLSGNYERWRTKHGYTGGVLQVHSLLKNSITYKVTARGELEIGSALEKAAYLQYGVEGVMPARPFIVVQDEDIEEIGILISEYIASRA